MGWIMFLLVLALSLAAVGLVVEAVRWLLIIGVVALITAGLIGWSRRDEIRGTNHLRGTRV